MNIRQQIREIREWCKAEGLVFLSRAECGICRPCVGAAGVWEESEEEDVEFPAYHWWDSEYRDISSNGGVWTPKDAYHKHPCTAVLIRESRAEAIRQLYSWVVWFKENGFHVSKMPRECDDEIDRMFHGSWSYRLVRNP